MSRLTEHSSNYDYLIYAVQRFSHVDRPIVLDFGCGPAQAVSLGLRHDIDIYGVDAFHGGWSGWRERLLPDAAARIAIIDTDALPFRDSQFDMVISNQVFEHIPDPTRILPEIRRVLKPGGQFLALFPTREIWYEGHLGLYFAHRLQSHPLLLRAYLILAQKLGLGLNLHGWSGKAWVDNHFNGLTRMCFYHRGTDVRRCWREVFRAEPASLAADYVEFRLTQFAQFYRWIPAPTRSFLFRILCHIRVGAVLLTVNNKV
jgi:SAM-dependent methyltransferase